MLGLAQRVGARLLLAGTNEFYGDPVHPQPESYRGCVNPIGIRSYYDEGKRIAETLFDYQRMVVSRCASCGFSTLMGRACCPTMNMCKQLHRPGSAG